ncbi:bud neck involved protein [Diplodia intermedia]|uniref:Bud neck involved protein n=1 Tax=Diplodia intermedia TaxID=856260 RepID=A0ABR3T4W6_9PEZI
MPRTQYYNTPGGGIGYRGSSATPVQAYAFQQTPQLRQENRSTSAPVNPYSQAQAFSTTLAPTKQGHATHPSSSSGSTASSSSSNQSSTRQRSGSKDDSALSQSHQRTKSATSSTDSSRQLSAINLSTSVPDLTLTSFDTPAKSSPDRYRRSRNTSSGPSSPSLPQDSKSAAPSGSGMAGVAHLYKNNAPNPRPGHNRTSSMDDIVLPRANSEQAKRYRRRSLNNFEGVSIQQGAPSWAPQQRQDARLGAHKNTSGESISSASNSTRPSSSKRENAQSSGRPSSPKVGQQSRSPNVPARGSSTDATKRVANPSPLSKTASDAEAPGSSGKASATDAVAGAKSPAAQHLAALNEKEKGVKSRLRRAFSFGSAAELRKASVENASSARMHQKVQQQDEIDPEDAAIAAKQEAAGIGNSIYSGQGGVFSSSTDNLSIQSTASSASVMLRKMGKGMKKSGRSLKGLFRPKSVIGVPAADSAVQASVGQVSMVNVEAEREKVNVNASPAEQAGGGTGFPKLERNSLEVASVSERPSSTGNADASRKSIMGGERERAEVLAAVRKGILKRTGTDSPSPQVRPADGAPGFTHNHDTPNSSAPSTPGDDNRPGNLALAGDDYFVAGSRFAAGSSRSLPTTPHGGPRNISFSPRIQFHDAFSSSEYDRRGDIATCNRLTPLLAQQIKEEINTFKMVCIIAAF